jgi:hypothetical protein
VEVAVDEFRPWSDPRFGHDDRAAGRDAAGAFAEEIADARDVMEDVGHDDGAERSVGEGKALAVEDDVDAGDGEDFGGDEAWDVVFQKTGAGAEFESGFVAIRNVGGDEAIPFVVDTKEEFFIADNSAAENSGPRVVDVEATGAGIGEDGAEEAYGAVIVTARLVSDECRVTRGMGVSPMCCGTPQRSDVLG